MPEREVMARRVKVLRTDLAAYRILVGNSVFLKLLPLNEVPRYRDTEILPKLASGTACDAWCERDEQRGRAAWELDNSVSQY